MSNKSYSDLLKSPKWQRKRLEIMKRDNFKCSACDNEELPLHVHHKEYIDGMKPWEYESNQLITLCEDCHLVVEYYKKSLKIDLTDHKFYRLKGYNADNISMCCTYKDGLLIFSIKNHVADHVVYIGPLSLEIITTQVLSVK